MYVVSFQLLGALIAQCDSGGYRSEKDLRLLLHHTATRSAIYGSRDDDFLRNLNLKSLACSECRACKMNPTVTEVNR